MWLMKMPPRRQSSSPAYQDMVFHPFVRRAFFDIGTSDPGHEPLVHCYAIRTSPGSRLLYEVRIANYQYFNNYWFFSELTSKDEELEHFKLLREAFRVDILKAEIGDQIEKLAGFLDRLYALRNNDALNRLAMIEIILGLGTLVTDYYGMNLPHLRTLLAIPSLSLISLVVTTIGTVASIWFVVYIVGSNWTDYRASLLPHRYRKALSARSLRTLRHEIIEEPRSNNAPRE